MPFLSPPKRRNSKESQSPPANPPSTTINPTTPSPPLQQQTTNHNPPPTHHVHNQSSSPDHSSPEKPRTQFHPRLLRNLPSPPILCPNHHNSVTQTSTTQRSEEGFVSSTTSRGLRFSDSDATLVNGPESQIQLATPATLAIPAIPATAATADTRVEAARPRRPRRWRRRYRTGGRRGWLARFLYKYVL